MVCNGGRGQRLMYCDYAVELTSVAMVVKVAWFMGGKGGSALYSIKYLCLVLCCNASHSHGSRSSMVYAGSSGLVLLMLYSDVA